MDELLSRDFLESIGVVLDEPTYQALSQHYEKTLNERVIDEIVDGLDDKQVEQLSVLRGGDSTLLQQWLVENVPKLDEIIEDEIAILLGDIAENSHAL